MAFNDIFTWFQSLPTLVGLNYTNTVITNENDKPYNLDVDYSKHKSFKFKPMDKQKALEVIVESNPEYYFPLVICISKGQKINNELHERSFTVVDAARADGCKTKFAIKGSGGRYISKDPEGAARKAFSRLCLRKRIRGQCAMIITVQELTQGSNGKTWTYKLNREKHPAPIELNVRVIEYRPVAQQIID